MPVIKQDLTLQAREAFHGNIFNRCVAGNLWWHEQLSFYRRAVGGVSDRVCALLFLRWFDKCCVMAFYVNGVMSGNVEHAPLDATVEFSLSLFFFLVLVRRCLCAHMCVSLGIWSDVGIHYDTWGVWWGGSCPHGSWWRRILRCWALSVSSERGSFRCC